MKKVRFYAIALFCTLLCANCQSNKTEKNNDSFLDTNEEVEVEVADDSDNEEVEVEVADDSDNELDLSVLPLREKLNLIGYQLDWAVWKSQIKNLSKGMPVKDSGFHFKKGILSEEVNSTDTTMVNKSKTKTTENLYYYDLNEERFVLLNGKKVMYNPIIDADYLQFIVINEFIIQLCKLKMVNDPRINKMKESKQRIINEAGYYLIYRDNEVRQDIKKLAEEHYNAIFSSIEKQGHYKKENKDGVYLFTITPAQEGGELSVVLFFNDDGYLKIYSSYIDRNKKAAQDLVRDWLFK